ncbi:MAG TPA: hypothetical protein VGS22_21470 [Thermoanaerobaculia bacterium]|jgi:hypothetical protein|nr:hypothetical protein [Thermoanaerobaculia bacterium]
MATIPFTKIFKEVPANCQLETFVELSSGHIECDVWVVDSDADTPDQNWFNSTVLRTAANPNAKGTAPIVGPAGCVLLANLVVVLDGTKGKMTLRVVDQNNAEIRREIWSFDGTGLKKKDVVNGVLLVQLA